MKLNPIPRIKATSALYNRVMRSPSIPTELIPKRRVNTYKQSLLNILRSKVKKKSVDEFPGRKENYILINSILRTLFPLFENEFLEIALSMTKFSFYFQKGRFSPCREFLKYLDWSKVSGPQRK